MLEPWRKGGKRARLKRDVPPHWLLPWLASCCVAAGESEQVFMGNMDGPGVDTYPCEAWRRVQWGVAAAAAPTTG